MTNNEMSFSDFAAFIRKKRSYITQLKVNDRLVLSEDSKRVLVAESIQRIADTMDPSKSAVVARHAANRALNLPVMVPSPENVTQPDLGETAGSARYQDSRAIREEYLAKTARRDYELSTGKLLIASDVLAVVSGAITALRSRLESLPDILGPQLAAISDESQTRTVLVEAIEHALEEASRQFAQISKTTNGE